MYLRSGYFLVTQKTNDKNATNLINQAIPMAVQRGNAASIMGTLDDYFDILVPKLSIH